MLSMLPWWYFAVALVVLLVFSFVCAAIAYERGFRDAWDAAEFRHKQFVSWLKESNEERDMYMAELATAVKKHADLVQIRDKEVIEFASASAELRSELEDVTRRKDALNECMQSTIRTLKVDMGKYGVQFDNPGFAPRTAVLALVNNVRSELRRELCTQNAIAERNALQDQLASLTDPAGPWAKKFIAAGVRKANKANKVKLDAMSVDLADAAVRLQRADQVIEEVTERCDMLLKLYQKRVSKAERKEIKKTYVKKLAKAGFAV